MDAFDEDGLRSICSDFLTRSLSLKCFVSKFLLQLRNDALFRQHLRVTDELRRHLEQNAFGDAFAADEFEPDLASPPADSPCVASRSLETSQNFAAALRYEPSQSSVTGAGEGARSSSSSSQDLRAVQPPPAALPSSFASPSNQTSSALSSAALPHFVQSLTPLGESKERVVDCGAKNVASSFTSQENLAAHAVQPQASVLNQPSAHQSPAPTSEIEKAQTAQDISHTDGLQQSLQVQHVDQGNAEGDQRQPQYQLKAALALEKYQEFIRQHQLQMPPPQTCQTAAIMVSVGQQTSQPQPVAAEMQAEYQRVSVSAIPSLQFPLQPPQDSVKSPTQETLTPASAPIINIEASNKVCATNAQSPPPSRRHSLPSCSSPVLSLSLSFNPNNFPSSPNGPLAPVSPVASRLPKVLPAGDGRLGFIVLPAAAHSDSSTGVVGTANLNVATVVNNSNHNVIVSPLEVCDKLTPSLHAAQSNSSDVETEGSISGDAGQEETLVIPETPTGTPVQSKLARSDGACASDNRRPKPHSMRLTDTSDELRISIDNRGEIDEFGGISSSRASKSSSKSRRNTVYAKVVALPTQPAESSDVAPLRTSSRGRPIRSTINFDGTRYQPCSAEKGTGSVAVSEVLHLQREKKGPGTPPVALSILTNVFDVDMGRDHEIDDDALLIQPVAISAIKRTHSSNQTNCPKRSRIPCDKHHLVQSSERNIQTTSRTALPTLELCNTSFIVTNVSSENTVDISKGHLDRTGTSKKVLVARAIALGMTAWTAVANINSSVVTAASCPIPSHLVVMCETVVSASTQMLVALALGITPLHCSWLSSCASTRGVVASVADSFVLPLDAIIPKEYSRISAARARHACVTPLPIEQRVLGGRRLGYYSNGVNAARIGTVLSFAGATVIPIVTDSSYALSHDCEYVVVDSAAEAMANGNNHVPFDWIVAVLCIGYVQPVALTPFMNSAAQTPLGLRSSRSVLKRPSTTEVVVVKETPLPSKRSRISAPSPAHVEGKNDSCRSSGSAVAALRPTSPAVLFPQGGPVSPSEKSSSTKCHEGAKRKVASSARHSRAASPALVVEVAAASNPAQIPSCFTLFDPATKAYLRFDESGSVTSKVYSREASSNCVLRAIESELNGPYPHRLQCQHKSFLCVGRDGSVLLAEKGAGGRALFKFAQSSSTRKGITFEIIHESGRFLSLNSTGAVVTTCNAADATKWLLKSYSSGK